jgi:2'-hydroxyisoflavone reductase
MIKIKRRQLLLGLSAVGTGIALSSRVSTASNQKPLKILVLGGTGFIGPHIVRRALDRGHELTLFNRGRSNTDLFPDVEKLVGDRDRGLDALKSGRWDVVLDNSGYVPRHVKDSAEMLKDRVGRYLYTSSISAYDYTDPVYPLAAGSKLNPWTNPDSEETWSYYGEFKAQCERLVSEVYADRATLVRPTYIVGPGDKSERFTWWVERIYTGGEVLAPGIPQSSFDIIDVRDLADFYVQLLEDDRSGTFNASGPAGRFTYGAMLNGIRATTGNAVNLTWVDAKFLVDQGVDGREMPMWNEAEDGLLEKMIENQTSIEAGLKFRPFAETAMDTLIWHRQLPVEQQAFKRVGIDPEKETRVLAAWHKHQNTNA